MNDFEDFEFELEPHTPLSQSSLSNNSDSLFDKVLEKGSVIVHKGSEAKDKIKQLAKERAKRLLDKINNAPFIRLRDKLAFTFGVINLVVSVFVAAHMPWYYYRFNAGQLLLLVIWRFYSYRKLNWGYFLLDFCYATAALVIYLTFFGRPLTWLFEVAFFIVNGPLAGAIVIWRNALVFHSLDKWTSVFLHLSPVVLIWCVRWYSRPADGYVFNETLESYWRPIGHAIIFYVLWQVLYAFKVYYYSLEKTLKKQRVSSYSWIREEEGHPLKNLMEWGEARLGIHPIITFCLTQFVYTVLLCLIPIIFYDSFVLHSSYLAFLVVFVAWSGADWYMTVFVRAYEKRLAKIEAEREQQRATKKAE